MSHPNGSSISIFTTSDDADGDTRRSQQSRRRIENRRERHNARRQLHVTAQVSIRRLLASA